MTLKFIPRKNEANIAERFNLNNSLDGLSLNGFVFYPSGYINSNKLIMNNLFVEETEINLNNTYNGKNIILNNRDNVVIKIPTNYEIEEGFYCYITMTDKPEFAYITYEKGIKLVGDTSFYTKKHDTFIWNYKSPTRPSLIEWNRIKLMKTENNLWYIYEGNIGIWWIE